MRTAIWDAADSRILAAALAVLGRGGLVAIPTDTVYGLAADPRVPGAEERLAGVKGRPRDKAIPLLAADLAQVERWPAELGPLARALARRYWPGALTMVLPCGGGRWEGFRVPAHPAPLALLRAADSPLRVTSANRSGAAPALTAGAAAAALGDAAELILDAGPAPGGRPSTVIRIEAGAVIVLREGAIPASEIHATAKAGVC